MLPVWFEQITVLNDAIFSMYVAAWRLSIPIAKGDFENGNIVGAEEEENDVWDALAALYPKIYIRESD